MPEDTSMQFQEGMPCPVKVEGSGGGLSFSPNGDMLLVAAIENPTEDQMKAWDGEWKAKLSEQSDFPSIPIFAINGEDWIIEAPCNPKQQEKESPGFCEVLYAKEHHMMVAILVDARTGMIMKIAYVELDEMFIERLVLSWNPYRQESTEYTATFTNEKFAERIESIFRGQSSKALWTSAW